MIMDTGSGVGLAYKGDYIIRDIKGGYYPCPESQFNELYDIIEEEA